MKVCDQCGKKFEDSLNGYKAEYYLKTHKKSCDRLFKKKQKAFIKNWIINDANEDEIDKVYNFIKSIHDEPIKPNIEMIIQEAKHSEEPIELKEDLIQEPIELKEDEAKHSQEPIELKEDNCDIVTWDDWEYQGEKYWVENETQDVYDRRDMLVGTRFINDIENWEINWAGIKDY